MLFNLFKNLKYASDFFYFFKKFIYMKFIEHVKIITSRHKLYLYIIRKSNYIANYI